MSMMNPMAPSTEPIPPENSMNAVARLARSRGASRRMMIPRNTTSTPTMA
jgi:hypothetical protein